jgi:hypothetical protein
MNLVSNRRNKIFLAEIEARGGETEIVTSKSGRSVTVECVDAKRDPHGSKTLYLYKASAWRYYTRDYSRPATLAYLCGVDDNGPWAVRVPEKITCVRDATAWLEPSSVTEARNAGKDVTRQGDVYVIPSKRDNFDKLPSSHKFDTFTRVLSHLGGQRPHGSLHVPHKAKFVAQHCLAMGRVVRNHKGIQDAD